MLNDLVGFFAASDNMSEYSTSFSTVTRFPIQTKTAGNRNEERFDSLKLLVAAIFIVSNL